MIVVTGMHRSGTSLVCQLLHRLGVPFGPLADGFAADRWNEPGYFESRAVMDLNSRIVTGFPRNRGALAALLSKLSYLTMAGPDRLARRAGGLRRQLATLAAEHAGHAVKDPRFCLTLRFWAELGEIDRVVVCLRRPADVVGSLWRRNRLPRALGRRFFDWHLGALLDQLPVDRAVFVDVDALTDERGEEELAPLRRFLALETGLESGALLREVVRADLYGRTAAPARRAAPATEPLWERALALAARRRREILDPAAGARP